jgi:hypothetical protein
LQWLMKAKVKSLTAGLTMQAMLRVFQNLPRQTLRLRPLQAAAAVLTNQMMAWVCHDGNGAVVVTPETAKCGVLLEVVEAGCQHRRPQAA